MPHIFDNIELKLLDALQEALALSRRADFCVGYFNLRGWRHLQEYVAKFDGESDCCRVLIGMYESPREELGRLLSLTRSGSGIDNSTALRMRKQVAADFATQLATGLPTATDEATLRGLAKQLRDGKVKVGLFLRHPLHAKLYLMTREDPINPKIAYLGSSNLTFSGLSGQGELNIDVLDKDVCDKLQAWFDRLWGDNWCLDISDDLATAIEESWAREDLIPPYHIYLKVAYHLSQEARVGLASFNVPRDFGNTLFEFQEKAVQIGAHHLDRRGGVLIGDVVGFGKTLMATALARIFQDDFNLETLIICPKNLVKMWEDYVHKYRMIAKVLSLSRVLTDLADLRRYRVVIIDESHYLRNREGKRYRAVREYIAKNECKCILLSATPYNKDYRDLSNQLRLFVDEELNIGIRPEKLLSEIGEIEFERRYQCSVRSLAAFERSEHVDDWREIMRLYMVRRTRSFIKDNYAALDPSNGRQFLTFGDGSRSYFPDRLPRTVKFKIDNDDPNDQYARLYSVAVVSTINSLMLPRYGLANYLAPDPEKPPTPAQTRIMDNLARAGKRLMGFCRSGLFKRLESDGYVFLQSVARHIMRNCVVLHAFETGGEIPIGGQDPAIFDTSLIDGDAESVSTEALLADDDEESAENLPAGIVGLRSEEEFMRVAESVYENFREHHRSHFKWLPAKFFDKRLGEDLRRDASALLAILEKYGDWDSERDAKLLSLCELLTKTHPKEKVIVFTQYSDTAEYLGEKLKARNIDSLEIATGSSADPTELAWRFSPVSNEKRESIPPERELRVLVSTDVLSEGQNLQDAYIVVNYDLPWAIIKLIQRVGRVDRIGQKAEKIFCYSFMPADGVERLINLRGRLVQRLNENAEVVGTDERFFEEDEGARAMLDLYHENSGILEGDEDGEVDLASMAYQIWKNAIDKDPDLEKTVPALPPVVHSTMPVPVGEDEPRGAIVYLRTASDADALIWLDRAGKVVTESQYEILKALECGPDTPALERDDRHYELVEKGVKTVLAEERLSGGSLGSPRGARFKTYERLKRYSEINRNTLMHFEGLDAAIEEIYRYPLRQSAKDTLNRQLKIGIEDDKLALLVLSLREENKLCLVEEEESQGEPQVICSMGRRKAK